MRASPRDFGKQAIHDHVVRLVAQRWAEPGRLRIDTNPGVERNVWTGPAQIYPDLVGWTQQGRLKAPMWIAEVETEETVTENEARTQWRDYASLGVPFFLIVPRGYRSRAQVLSTKVGIAPKGIYEYGFLNTSFLLG